LVRGFTIWIRKQFKNKRNDSIFNFLGQQLKGHKLNSLTRHLKTVILDLAPIKKMIFIWKIKFEIILHPSKFTVMKIYSTSSKIFLALVIITQLIAVLILKISFGNLQFRRLAKPRNVFSNRQKLLIIWLKSQVQAIIKQLVIGKKFLRVLVLWKGMARKLRTSNSNNLELQRLNQKLIVQN